MKTGQDYYNLRTPFPPLLITGSKTLLAATYGRKGNVFHNLLAQHNNIPRARTQEYECENARNDGRMEREDEGGN